MPRSNKTNQSYVSNTSPPSESSYLTSRTNKSGRAKAKIQVAENPLCPRIKGLCCLMVLFNLALILICLGFALVLQFFEPGYIWYFGIFMLVFGFITLIGSFIYCAVICQEHRTRVRHEEEYVMNGQQPLYWGKQSEFGSSSEINYDNKSGKSIDFTKQNNANNNQYHQDERY